MYRSSCEGGAVWGGQCVAHLRRRIVLKEQPGVVKVEGVEREGKVDQIGRARTRVRCEADDTAVRVLYRG